MKPPNPLALCAVEARGKIGERGERTDVGEARVMSAHRLDQHLRPPPRIIERFRDALCGWRHQGRVGRGGIYDDLLAFDRAVEVSGSVDVAADIADCKAVQVYGRHRTAPSSHDLVATCD